jgi:hypothetical protein
MGDAFSTICGAAGEQAESKDAKRVTIMVMRKIKCGKFRLAFMGVSPCVIELRWQDFFFYLQNNIIGITKLDRRLIFG